MKIPVILLLIVAVLYFFHDEDRSKLNEMNSVEFAAKNRIITIALDNELDLDTVDRYDSISNGIVSLNEVIDKGASIYADGVLRYNGICKHVQIEWQKDKLFTPEYYVIILNKKC